SSRCTRPCHRPRRLSRKLRPAPLRSKNFTGSCLPTPATRSGRRLRESPAWTCARRPRMSNRSAALWCRHSRPETWSRCSNLLAAFLRIAGAVASWMVHHNQRDTAMLVTNFSTPHFARGHVVSRETAANLEEPEEVLVADPRGSLTPAQMVDQKLLALVGSC